MPRPLLQVHQQLDRAVDRGYRPEPFPSHRHRVEYLFVLYEQLTALLVAAAKPPSLYYSSIGALLFLYCCSALARQFHLAFCVAPSCHPVPA